jgi:cell division protease FtsH
MKQTHKTILIWALLIVMFVAIFNIMSHQGETPRDIDMSDFIAKVERGEVASVTIKSLRITGTYRNGKGGFTTYGPITDDLTTKLLANNVSFKYDEPEQASFWQSALISWLPVLLLFFLFMFFMRQLQAGGGKALSFGKSRARLMTENQNKVTFKDVAGVEEAKEELEEIIEFLRDPKKFTRLGGRIPKGVLLMGPPGTGKTLLARAIAGEAGVPFFSIAGSDFVEMFVGVGASRVRDLFEQGKKSAPCIIFIDEIDAVGRHRGAGLGGGHDEREQTLNQLLVEMDGFESNDGVILVAATNRPDVLDPALLRPGRFDRRVVVPRPDVRGRLGILKVHTRRTVLDKDVELEIVARGTPGFSGADLENVVNEAVLLAARKGKDHVNMVDFEESKDKVLMGTERRSMVISDKDKRVTAIHEAGHVIVAKLLPDADPVHKVTVIPRGAALGLTQQLPEEDRLNMSRTYCENQIAILMGGRIAEELTYGQLTTGAGNDIKRATELAQRMVCEWGMSDKLGPLTFGRREEQVFLGRDITQQQDYSEQTAIEIDREVRRYVMDNYNRAKALIQSKLDVLNGMADALMEYETLDAADIDVIMAGNKMTRPNTNKPRSNQAPPSAAAPATVAVEEKPSLLGPMPDPTPA